jgi:hypothetical protein
MMPEGAKAIEKVVRNEIGSRGGDWLVSVLRAQWNVGYIVTIEGPNGKWERTYLEGSEHTPEFIRDRISRLLEPPLGDRWWEKIAS